MSPNSSFFVKLLLFSFCNLLRQSYCSSISSHGSSGSHTNSPSVSSSSINDWHRNLESQLSRLVGRLDQLELRVGRVQSLVQMRFDNIENGLTTTKLRLDLWGDEFNRIEESLTRKWKILESKFDLMISNVDNKVESKLTSMQRDNRRHNEILGSSFNAVAQAHERLNEKVHSSMAEVNSSLEVLRKEINPAEPPLSPSVVSVLVQNSDKMLYILQEFISNSTSQQQSNNPRNRGTLPGTSNQGGIHEAYQNHSLVQYQLLGNKVTNMFEDLIKRSSSMESTVKDVIVLTNFTRKDVHDGFRTLLASSPSYPAPSQHYGHQGSSRNSHSSNNNRPGGTSINNHLGHSSSNSGGGSSSEVISAVIVEALTSVESMSNALGRRMTEFTRSIDEKLEMVSMSINGFLESCIRIQDGAPLIEDHIADMLIKILDTVDNSTRSASELWQSVARQILEPRHHDDHRNGTAQCPPGINPSSSITSTETITESYDQEDNNVGNPSRRTLSFVSQRGNDSRLLLSSPPHEDEDDGGQSSSRRLQQPPLALFLEEETDYSSSSGRRPIRPHHHNQQSTSTSPNLRKRPGRPSSSSSTNSPGDGPRTSSSHAAVSHLSSPDDDEADILTEEDRNSLWESYFPQVPE